MLYLVRHAKAGDRSSWVGDDRLRPLSGKGNIQSARLAERLRAVADGELVSSPYLRCVQTLEPLAAALGVAVRVDERLAEDAGCTGAIELLSSLSDGSVLSSHGDVIPETIAALQRRGCAILTEPDWRKATVWAITRAEDGTFVDAGVWATPDE